MSGVDPVSLAITGLTTLSSMKQGRGQAKASAAARASAVEEQRRQILEARKIEERREKDRLKRELASRRAMFGASGAGGGGSAAAVLAGLTEASRRRMADARRMDSLSLSRHGGAAPSRGLFDGRLGRAAGLLEQIGPHLSSISLFDRAPSASVPRGRVRPTIPNFRKNL